MKDKNALEGGRISVLGARVHNLKNIDVDIPRNKLSVITGMSGSGKSSLAFDTIFAEGQQTRIRDLQWGQLPRFMTFSVCFMQGRERLIRI